MNTVTRSFSFDAAHRLLNYPGKCRHIHGHSYKAEVEVGPGHRLVAVRRQAGHRFGLDHLGMVCDFGRVKEVIGKWIDTNWDHNIILHPDDPLLSGTTPETLAAENGLFMGKAPFVMPRHLANPTAENMTLALVAGTAEVLSEDGFVILRVRIHETEACSAVYDRRA